MASIVEDYLESPGMEQETDDVFPCKGCGEILEEGKAFELAGNRWHLDCFRCNTCGTLLDSDANLLLLGDGSLICNNCTYSCSACGNKIEDLAILTGEQAFCATCFRCRNCKRKIENLRYARTSQGIFCMGCHETLMARRRKKSKAAAAAKAREKEHSPMITEKSLPALPANAIPPNAFSNDRVDPDSDTATELSPRPRNHTRHESSSRSSSRPARSPERKPDGLNLPSTTYRSNRNSTMVSRNENNTNDDGFLISVALDPSPHPTPKSTSDNLGEGKSKDGDYFGSAKPPSEKRNDSRTSTPHIAFQSKGRQASTSEHDIPPKLPDRKHSKSSQRESAKPSPAIDEQKTSGRRPPTEDFKLQEAPKSKKLLSRSSSQSSSIPAETNSVRTSNGQPSKAGQGSLPHTDSNATTPASRSSLESRYLDEEELRASMDSSTRTSSRPENAKPLARKDVPSSSGRNGIYSSKSQGYSQTLTERLANGSSRQQSRQESPEDPTPTRQTPSRSISEQKKTYTQPRSAPAPPGSQRGQKDENGEPKVSPKLPRWSSGGDFSMDEDMARILGTDEGSTSILRRVSNAVRHGRTSSVESPNQMHPGNRHTRSISETTRATGSPRWPRTPVADDYHAQDISSPMSLTSGDDPAFLKRQLRNSEQRVAELERQFTTEKDLKSLNRKLVEKRKTVSVLDTQTEIMIRQLEVLAGYVERAKETKTPVDPRDLEESAIKEFVQKLDKVKSAMSAAIEQLHEERDLLCEEKDQAIADRDRALLEFEQLSSKNAQLADMNNDLTHQIQERFKSQIGGDIKSPGALGIYGVGKGLNASSLNLDAASLSTGATLVPADEEPIVEAGPTVVQVRKGQAKKFNWKKGSKGLAQGVAKGVNRAVVAFQNDRERMQQQGGLTGENIGMPYNMTVAQVEAPAGAPSNGHVTHDKHSTASALAKKQEERERERQGFGFFGKKNAMPKSGSGGTMSAADAAEPATVLFGSDLAERADHERRQIPSVVTRCIEEVELRGMDQEGIYRKTGGNSQVNMIKDGFSKDENFDISDPDLDITAVTSVLKQYFRKLPVPLLTFDVYERVLESNAIVDEEERSDHLRKTFASMPQRHRDCLEFLMFHLARVAQREPENLMSPKNLAVVFAPTIMRDTSLEREMTDMHAKNLAIQFVIENSNTIFEDA
ncbi:Rho-type gtpase-activating protein [Fusarium irregulare]|uniref:Rho-type gtpase-activating protein n=1 Tax=Fusarium irregulare TaxID=2494466 RepID=A0A9W8UCD1_9HYPO|nr:Rho-type gtpase-activating protein [Fusarium irregulare]KAJ4020764.1 Rho-type gtpase-activating protein [Fusarium irregulare]